MASPDPSPADVAFERLLLRSASTDGPSAEAAHEAWKKLALSAAGAGALVAGGGVAAKSFVAKKAAFWAAAKWLVAGAVLGSAVTVGLMQGERPGVSLVRVHRPESAITESAVRAERPAPPAASRLPEPVSEPAARATRHRSTSVAPTAAVEPVTPAVPARKSTLGAEVALLDAARGAIASGANDEALRLVGEYRRTFPRGALSADAEVIAIDAMIAQQRDVRSHADKFLSRFPNDPHAPRIRKHSSEP